MTTGRSAKRLQGRAEELAARLSVPFIPRVGGGVNKLLARHSLSFLYVVGKAREWVVDAKGERLFVHEGLFTLRSAQKEHPLLRLFNKNDPVIDATCGLAQDALFLAHHEREVIAYEGAPIVFSLLEHGLARLRTRPDAVGQAAARIRLHFGQAQDFESKCIYFDPMWQNNVTPSLLSRVAQLESIDFSRFKGAARVVIKSAPGAPAPLGLGQMTCLSSKRADFWSYESQGKM